MYQNTATAALKAHPVNRNETLVNALCLFDIEVTDHYNRHMEVELEDHPE